MELLLLFLSGCIFGYLYFAIRLRNRILEIINEHDIKLDDDEPTQIPVFKTEVYNDLILLYDDKSNFMTQGLNLDEIGKNLFTHKNIKIAQIIHNEKTMLVVNGTVKENNLRFISKPV